MTVWIETAKSSKDGDAKLQGLIIASQLPNQGGILYYVFFNTRRNVAKKESA
jgi:hypothetical protein